MIPKSHTKAFLHIFLLCSLAVAQPLYDLVGATPEFLVAHRLEPVHLIGWVLALSLGLPLLLFLLYRVCGVISEKLGRTWLALWVCLLVTMALLPAVVRLLSLDGYLAVTCAALAGIAFTLLYFRRQGLRMFLTWFAVAGLVFPLNFVWFSGASGLLSTGEESSSHEQLGFERTPPVIIVVFDEFPLLSILDDELEIDAGRFPNFSALTETASWYRFHTTNSDSTLVSIPNLLSGNLPFGRDRGLPSYQDFSNNLLSLARGHFEISATEHGTRLCPDTVCDPQPAYFRMLFTDSAVILGQIWAPPEFARHLPATNNDWLGFLGEKVDKKQDLNNIRAFQKTINWRTRVTQFDEFVSGISDEPGKLYYMHSMFPHASWRHMPDGSLLTADPGGGIVGISPNEPGSPYKHVWYDSDAAARVSRQRHILQVGFVDTMIGNLVARLKALGVYDESLLVITSDHGVGFHAGHSRRNIHGDNLVDISGVPLFIKFPGSQPNGISDQNSQGMDILPTMLEALGARGWTEFDGQSLLDTAREEHREKIIFSEKMKTTRISFADYQVELTRKAKVLTAEYGQGNFDSLFLAGDSTGMIGSPLDSLDIVTGEAPAVQYEYGDLLKNNHREGAFTQYVVHGNFEGRYEDNPSEKIAVSVNGIIRAVSEPFTFPGQDNGFQVLLSPGSFAEGPVNIRTWFVIGQGPGLQLLEAPGEQTYQYALYRMEGGGWAIEIDGQPYVEDRGEVPGWVTVSEGLTPGTWQVGGWAADLAAEEPAARIIAFIDGEYYYGMTPNRDTKSTAERYNMPGILHSAFRFPISVPAGKNPRDMVVRVFALSKAGELSELNYPRDRERWVFRQNPTPPGEAIKPFRDTDE